MKTALTGVITALLTPYDEQFRIDEASLRSLVRHNIQQGVDGLYVGGSTAEALLQNSAERRGVLRIVAEEAKGKLALVAHIGGISTAESCALAEAAAEYGYDAVSAVTPFYYPFTFPELRAHYSDIIAAAQGKPMIIYNIPAMSGVKLGMEELGELLSLPNVAALKHTSGDFYQLEQIHRAYPDKILYNGYDEIFLSGQMAGAQGGIGSTYNVMGWRYQGILRALANRDIDLARRIQSSCNQVIDVLVKTGVFGGLKTILQEWGVIRCAACRKPFSPVQENHLPELKRIARELQAEFQHHKN
ncbi:N-acetylneuraminate lyase [Sodalis sp. RH15]|uniref:N-acetylneuraminate lyase n=1 Tax=Sodalis sp. RH15 TaxID=3394330 RepID=UPI0039B4B4CB